MKIVQKYVLGTQRKISWNKSQNIIALNTINIVQIAIFAVSLNSRDPSDLQTANCSAKRQLGRETSKARRNLIFEDNPITNPHFVRWQKSSNFLDSPRRTQTHVTPCTKPCHTLYQALSHLVPNSVAPCTKPCHTLYQVLSHLVPNSVTPFTRLCHTMNQTLSHLVPDFVTPCTKPCHT